MDEQKAVTKWGEREGDRRMNKEEFKAYIADQADILYDGDADGDGRLDVVDALVTLAAVQDDSFDLPMTQEAREGTIRLLEGLLADMKPKVETNG